MYKRGFASPLNGRAIKADRLNRRVERQDAKALRKADRQLAHAGRRAAGIRGAEIAGMSGSRDG
jgi:hypothetical protein